VAGKQGVSILLSSEYGKTLLYIGKIKITGNNGETKLTHKETKIMDGSGNEKEKQEAKYCPFLNGDCIEKRCNLYIEMVKAALQQAGFKQTFGMCAFTAMTQMLSEMNMKTPLPQEKIKMHNILGR